MPEDEFYEVWVQDYNTFGSSDSYVYERYRDRDAAEFHAAFLSENWGQRAEVRKVEAEKQIREIDVRTLRKELSESHGSYAKTQLDKVWREFKQRKAKEQERKVDKVWRESKVRERR